MTDARTLLQRALEALDACTTEEGPCQYALDHSRIVRDAIRSHLAAEPVEAVPVAWVIPGDDNARDDGYMDAMAWQEGEFSRPLYAATPAPTAEPVEPKPVAWVYKPHRDILWPAEVEASNPSENEDYEPLYAAPPAPAAAPPVPLTDEQIWDAVEHGVIGGIGFPSKAIKIARAIEHAHGIGEAKCSD